MSENERGGSAPAEKKSFMGWIENYFYHYKWHTVIALVVIFAIVICSVQMCQKTSFDLHIMYAGSDDIRMTAKEGDISEYQKLLSGIKPYTSDADGDGNININLLNLYMPSSEEIAEIQNSDKGYEANLALIAQNNTIFQQNLQYGDYYVCFISERLFKEHTEGEGIIRFAPIDPYLEGNTSAIKVNDYGIYLSSLPVHIRPGFNLLGENTVLCIRRMDYISGSFDKDNSTATFRHSEELLRALISAE